jgi:hypothetical protein
MPKVADKQEPDAAELSPEQQPDLGEKKEAAPQKDEAAEAADAAAPAGGEQKEEAADQKQVAPRIRIAQPSSGDAYPMNTKLPIVLECEGTGQFDAQLQLRDAKGVSRSQLEIPVDLGAENKGSAEVVIDLEKAIKSEGELGDHSGTYQLHAYGSDGSGQMAPMSRINIDIIDEDATATPNMPKDVANAPPDDKPSV